MQYHFLPSRPATPIDTAKLVGLSNLIKASENTPTPLSFYPNFNQPKNLSQPTPT